MKKALSIIFTIVLLHGLTSPVWATDPGLEQLPVISLPVPEDSFDKSYLGLENFKGTTFTMADIDADILLIELFSLYCPYCQKEAPIVNELYETIGQTAKNGPKVKIIGIGVSNSPFEVEQFRDVLKVSFPLFADRDRSIYKILKGAGTPGFIGVRLNGKKKPTIILRNTGGFDSPDDFLKQLIRLSGYNTI